MNSESRKRLEDFIERAEYIQSLSYLENADNLGGFKISQVNGKSLIEFYQPENEKRDALLFNLRLFVQDKDNISLRRLAELCSDPDISDKWKDEFQAIRKNYNVRLDQIIAEGPKGKLSYRDVFNMFLFGKLGHMVEDDNQKLYNKWVRDNTEWEILHNTFHETLFWLVITIINISRVSKEELKRF
jgi:hypothetical protein